ncbi:hypothetical protein P9112_014596 [Eukaryota sp. TZLM1-RC]
MLSPFTEVSRAIWDQFQDQATSNGSTWTKQTTDYWNEASTDADGMLGGFGNLSGIDIAHSLSFLRRHPPTMGLNSVNSVIDVGSGIGRITKSVLLPVFRNAKISLLEPSLRFLEHSKTLLSSVPERIADRFCLGFQSVSQIGSLIYDVYFLEWVLLYLNDDEVVESLEFCQSHLSKGGCIVIKENVTFDGGLSFDEDDNSVTRPCSYFEELFTAAGLSVVARESVPNWPKELFEVICWKLEPCS